VAWLLTWLGRCLAGQPGSGGDRFS